jgi:tRNA modification GTPase
MVVIVGAPNAGKSSLFNALAGADRAIVTEVPGTTRDVLTERVDVGGLPITLVDTAGLREAADPVEAEGVARARQARDVAALTIVVLDRSVEIGDAERRILRETALPRLIVGSKADLAATWGEGELGAAGERAMAVSALTGAGLGALREAIVAAMVDREELRDAPAISNVRHLGLVDAALAAVTRASSALSDGATEELVLLDVGSARQALEELTGARTPDDLLHHIFAKFCVGK